MPNIVIDGLVTRYEIYGSGPPILMFSPGGFDSSLENWTSFSIYSRLRLLEHLSTRYSCITFDRRESGSSAGRVEVVGWDDYANQGKALLDHLGIERAHLMGGCVGCSSVVTLANRHSDIPLSMVLYSPAGGPKYRLTQSKRLTAHASFAEEHGLREVVNLALQSSKTFSQDPRLGPWVSPIRNDEAFARSYVLEDPERYQLVLRALMNSLFSRDTVPGPDAEELMLLRVPALIVPGQDSSHAPSAARYLQECLAESQYWDMPVTEQTEETAPVRVLEFLNSL